MLRKLEQYGVRAGHLADVLMLEGPHEDSAVVSVELTSDVHAYTRIPTFATFASFGGHGFVTHPQIARFIRREVSGPRASTPKGAKQ